MKYVVIVPDGAADYPCEELEGKTPLEVAETPNMDYLAKEGLIGRVKTIPKGFNPSSDVANLSLLGYEPEKYYTGRGPLEAANMGIELSSKDVAFRCNLITEVDGILSDYSAGHISNRETQIIIEILNKNLGSSQIRFFPGVSYRNLMVFKDGLELNLQNLKTFPPHDIMGSPINKFLPKGENSRYITELIQKSKQILSTHEINTVRVDLGENPANMIWLWGQGIKPQIPNFKEKFGKEGAIISAVDLIKGIGKIIGFKVIEVEGATGFYDTNYQGKAKSALKALGEVDLVYIHIEATDEAGHNQDLRMKITCLERIDKLVLGTILAERDLKDTRILVVPDHFTPLSKRTHTPEPVPFVIAGEGIPESITSKFSEEEAQRSSLYFEKPSLLMEYLIKK
ncbi:MAG TPA: cofactor-independent phosphoglycerate mutase [Candidatus Omnitrophica bacterium]|nr:MAG: cofactor-independent phosphoglycerate mutase [Candidatus Omnitrophota bacterium]RKY34318.1 MAG: cofactor-independent phosphoglycerate mutase [Candidatus Omnitrophota bacterium]RKY43114.1 MAG: cofactor-independent phosphoglycerate mutase [Candidatus Omnitrophota bacterium]HEC70017.1 cofactor-independent phosphoglycerate mutase [Candidatus Omnitrophota bacterium]